MGGFIPQFDRNGALVLHQTVGQRLLWGCSLLSANCNQVKQVDIQMGTGLVTPKPRVEDQETFSCDFLPFACLTWHLSQNIVRVLALQGASILECGKTLESQSWLHADVFVGGRAG